MDILQRLDPNYGNGVFRRRLRIQVSHDVPNPAAGSILVELEDNNHAFRVRLRHDGATVREAASDSVRHPFTTCPEASQPLQRVLGVPLDADEQSVRQRLVPGDNCTHLFDMTMLALGHASDFGLDRVYDITVDDEHDGIMRARITCNGQMVHDWQVQGHTLVTPVEYAGKPVMRGFYAWAAKVFAGMPLEAAVALQRGFFVAQSRRYISQPIAKYPATTDGVRDGICYSYNHGVVERALRIEGSVRDHTASAERLLKFDPMPSTAKPDPPAEK